MNRLDLQCQLDAVKSQVARNRLGQFATPPQLAQEIVAYAQTLLPASEPIHFLDPAFGTGVFFEALQASPTHIVSATGYEIDAHYGSPTKAYWQQTNLTLHVADFTRCTPITPKANLLICNPPYVRHHHLTQADKRRLQARVEQETGIRPSGLSGLYAYFLLLAHQWVQDGALSCWLVPSEFMDVNYGKAIRQYLCQQVTLLRVHRFSAQDSQFADALVSSALLFFRKSPPVKGHEVVFSKGGTLNMPQLTRSCSLTLLNKATKWNDALFKDRGQTAVNRHPSSLTKQVPLSDLFTIKRGIATGANKFFILTEDQVAEYKLPQQFLRPILPSPRYLPMTEIEADANGRPRLPNPLFLLDCSLPEAEIQVRFPSLWHYLQIGVEAGVDMGYLCSHRPLWYQQEKRPPAPIVCTYMGRKRGDGSPFRFILNGSQATAGNVYLMLYPTSAFQARLEDNPSLLRNVWQQLNDISADRLIQAGRVYGGGLHKLEPKELGNLPITGW